MIEESRIGKYASDPMLPGMYVMMRDEPNNLIKIDNCGMGLNVQDYRDYSVYVMTDAVKIGFEI